MIPLAKKRKRTWIQKKTKEYIYNGGAIERLSAAPDNAYETKIKQEQKAARIQRKKENLPKPIFTETCPECYYYAHCDQRTRPWLNDKVCEGYQLYIDQDYVGLKEAPFTIIGCDKSCISEAQNVFLMEIPATKSQIISLFFTYHLTITQIADMLYKSHQYISKVIRAEIARKALKRAKTTH